MTQLKASRTIGAIVIFLFVAALLGCAGKPPSFALSSTFPESPTTPEVIGSDQLIGLWDGTAHYGFITYKYRLAIKVNDDKSINYHLKGTLYDAGNLKPIYRNDEIVAYFFITKPGVSYEAIGKYKWFLGMGTRWKPIKVSVGDPNTFSTATSKSWPTLLSYRAMHTRSTPLSVANKTPSPKPVEGTVPKLIGGSGTGFVVRDGGYVLTCQHVIEKAVKITIRTQDGLIHEAVPMSASQESDLCLIRVNSLRAKPIPYESRSRIKVGQTIYTLGYPRVGNSQSHELVAGDGVVAALKGPNDSPVYYQVTVPVNQGNSGGPIFDSYGNWIGIVSIKAADLYSLIYHGEIPQGINFAVKGNLGVSLLKGVEDSILPAPLGPSPRALEAITDMWRDSVLPIDVKY